MVPRTGIEPVRLAARDFKSLTSTYFVIEAMYFVQVADYSDALGTVCTRRTQTGPRELQGLG
jgi:hypothetical protein